MVAKRKTDFNNPKDKDYNTEYIANFITLFEGSNQPMLEDNDEYIADWIMCSATLNQWLQHKNVDLASAFADFNLSCNELNDIESHQFILYNQLVSVCL